MMESNFVEANGIRIHYHRSGGNKPQVLLLHGLTDNGACWTPVIEQLKDDYDCIALDARGHGQSDAPATGYAPDDHAADAVAFIKSLKLNRPVLLGHSMGGAVSALVASQQPGLVRAAIFEDPAWFSENPSATTAAPDEMRQSWLKDLREKKAYARQDLIKEGRKRTRWSDAELGPWADAKAQVHEEVLQWMDAPPINWRTALKQVQCPTLLVTGDVDLSAIISPEQAAEAQAQNAQLHVVYVAGTGHCIRRDDFASFIAAVDAFLARTA